MNLKNTLALYLSILLLISNSLCKTHKNIHIKISYSKRIISKWNIVVSTYSWFYGTMSLCLTLANQEIQEQSALARAGSRSDFVAISLWFINV